MLQMASIEEGNPCKSDGDCPALQYCYEVSGHCVDYTLCKRYNRQEAQDHSRHPSQCGPCLPGYDAEILGTGEREWLCKKSSFPENVPESWAINSDIIIMLVGCGILIVLVIAVIGVLIKRSRKKVDNRMTNKCTRWVKICERSPSAPPPEHSPFIGMAERVNSSPHNNNRNLKDKNALVMMAAPFKDPHWIRSNPNYAHHMSDEELNEDQSSSAHATVEVPDEEDSATNNNSWNQDSRQLAVQIPSVSISEFAPEHRDNTLNAVLVQRSFTRSSPNSEGNNANPTPEASDTQNDRDRNRTSNVLITQKITMNLNVLNGDC